MIQAIKKDGGYKYSVSFESKKLYQLYLKDGNKLFTDLSGFKKINKVSDEHNFSIPVK